MRRKGNLLVERPRTGISVEIPFQLDAAIMPTDRDEVKDFSNISLAGRQAELHDWDSKYEDKRELMSGTLKGTSRYDKISAASGLFSCWFNF